VALDAVAGCAAEGRKTSLLGAVSSDSVGCSLLQLGVRIMLALSLPDAVVSVQSERSVLLRWQHCCSHLICQPKEVSHGGQKAVQDSFTFAQNLPLAGKALATLVATAVWLFVCYAVWQKPKAATHHEAAAQFSSPAKPNVQGGRATVEPAVNSKRDPHNRARKPKDEPAATPPVVSVGDVSSQNQTGGVTAGYVGNVDQKQ
jgi:hypothetical protein